MRLLALVLAFVSVALAQQTSFKDVTGTRSLWIPFQTVSGIPLASIASNDSSTNVTVYVISCPSASPDCAISPNLTLTEGPSTAHYDLTTTSEHVALDCTMTGTTEAVCSEVISYDGNIQKPAASTLSASQIVYQAVDVTATNKNTATDAVTVTVTAKTSTTSTSSTSTSKAEATMTSGPWALGGAIGAGLVALAAL